MTNIRTRIAPTPSGSLHLGNVANFLLIEKLARGGTIRLRIDDCDGTRARREFVEHIFSTLKWLGIEWQEGPRDAADFYANFSQVARKDYYFSRLAVLGDRVYACACSRKEVNRCGCREGGLEFVAGKISLRLKVEEPELARKFGDVVLWRKDDGPAYQWASVIDDLDDRINLIVRGEDLRDSSELQKYIAELVAPGGLSAVKFVHHPLIAGPMGEKLSKSQGAPAVAGDAKALRAQLAPILEEWSRGAN